MKSRMNFVGLVLAATLVAGVAAPARAQDAAAASRNSGSGHSVWRDSLIGLGIGTATGLGIGAMRENFHDAECKYLNCNRTLEMKTMAPIGAATGALLGFLVHHVRHMGAPRVSSSAAPATVNSRGPRIVMAPSYTARRKAIVLQAEF